MAAPAPATNVSPCPLCLSDYTTTTRKKITCQYCPAAGCRSCMQTSILRSNTEPACYECKREWNTEFMNDTFGVTFRTKTLRVHRRKIVSERERALLPSMQFFVGLRKEMDAQQLVVSELYPIYTAHSAKYNEIYSNVRLNRDIIARLTVKLHTVPLTEEEQETMRVASEKYRELSQEGESHRIRNYLPASGKYHTEVGKLQRLQHRYNTGEDGAKKERREFMMRCPGTDCRGFLSTAYKCGTCSKKTCSACTEIIADDIEHVCKPESVESTKAIKKETRPCPKCAAPIYKIDGCDQMWCTNGGCNTAFSWDTGRVVTGRVHNPHYYEWIRRNGGGQAPREVGDIPCGGIPAYHLFAQPFFSKYTTITSKIRAPIFEIHRHIVEIEEALPRYPQQVPALMNKDIDVAYLMNRITEDDWIVVLEQADTKFQKKREIGQILHTLVTATADILRDIYQRMSGPETCPYVPHWLENDVLPMLESLRTYTNETFKKLATASRSAMPQIGTKWQLMSARLLHKNTIVEAPGS